jgi:hypothetical protein
VRRSQLWALVAWLALEASMAIAQSPADSVVEQLRAQGYVEVEVSRTLLWRIRVVAQAPDGGWREIVLNRGTGEILRDYSEEADGSRVPWILARPEGEDLPGTVASLPRRGGGSEQPRSDRGNRESGGAQGSNGGDNPGQGQRD